MPVFNHLKIESVHRNFVWDISPLESIFFKNSTKKYYVKLFIEPVVIVYL